MDDLEVPLFLETPKLHKYRKVRFGSAEGPRLKVLLVHKRCRQNRLASRFLDK